MSFKKINKEYLITDSTVNTYGYRLLTDGYMMEEFQKNPIGYHMHGTEEHPQEQGALVKWEDFRKEGDKVYAKPCINLYHPRGQKTVNEVENGFLNGASMGSIVAVEMSHDPGLKLPGQTGPTITKWHNKECSLVDIPANVNALAPPNLYDLSGGRIDINRYSVKNLKNEHVHNESVQEKESIIENMIKEAIRDKVIDAKTANELKESAYGDPIKLKAHLDKFYDSRFRYLRGLNWDELDQEGLLQELKERSFREYRDKFYAEFGTEPQPEGSNTKPLEKKDGQLSINQLLVRAVDNNDLYEGWADNVQAHCGNDRAYVLKVIEDGKKARLKFLMEQSWDDLDKECLIEELKERDYDSFTEKFRKEFGVEYKSTKEKLNHIANIS